MTASHSPMDDPSVARLLELCRAFGVSGFEDEVRDYIRGQLDDCADEVWTDTLGNLYALRRGRDERRLMLDAHMDEIGLIVQSIDEGGFLSFDTIGGWDARILPGQAVEIQTSDGRRVPGMIGSQPPHVQKPADRSKPIPVDSMFIDIGASSSIEAEELGVRIGEPVLLSGLGLPKLLAGDRLAARALDNRVGCAVSLAVLKALAGEDLDLTVVAAFTTTEEVGLRGATVAGRLIAPEICLVLEGTVAGDVPGAPPNKQPSVLGRGPAIAVADKRYIAPRRMVQFIERLAADEGLSCQRKKPAFGGTDGGAVHISGKGVLTGVVACPCRYIHAPTSILSLRDFFSMIQLSTAFTRRASELVESSDA